MYALAEQRIFCFEKMVLKLSLLLVAIAVFSGQNMSLSAYNVKPLLNGYIVKERVDALFLLKEKYKGYNVDEVGDGVAYIRQNRKINGRNIKINIAEIDRGQNPNLVIVPKLASNSIHSKAQIANIAQNALLAVNGTYFKQNTGTPLGALVIDKEIITGPIYERVALGIGKNGFKTGRLAFEGTLKNANYEIKIDNINQPRMLHSQVLVYTQKWGERSPETKANCKHLAIRDGKIVATSAYPLFIPDGGIVISAPEEKLQGFELGDKVKVNYALIPNWNDVEHIISGGPYLLKEGKVFIDTASQKLNGITGRNPRTAVGYTKENVMITVTVDGRKEGSGGVTLQELAKIMEDLGCYEAINLDGGSSTVMYVGGKTLNGSNVKSTAVSNALVVKTKGV